jgi:branched-chain amino acid transport system permease protein
VGECGLLNLLLQELLNGVVTGSTYAMVALGFALTFTVMRVVNLAHPDLLMVAMFATVVLGHFTNSAAVLVIGAVAVAAVLGASIERFVLRPLRNQNLLMPLIATAGVSIVLENFAAGTFGSDPVALPPLLPTYMLTAFGLYLTLPQLVTAAVAAAMMVLVGLYVRRTSWGMATRALADRPEVASAFGIDVNRVAQVTIILASVLAAVAGLSLGAEYQSASAFVAASYTLKAFVCMLIAGNRHIEAVMATGLLLGVLEVLVSTYVSSAFRDAVAFSVLIVILYFRPNGLFGSYQVRA